MELHKVPRGSYVRTIIQDDNPRPQTKGKTNEVRVPISCPEIKLGELIYFSHIDGMYSLCFKVDEITKEHGESCHMAAWTEVEIVDIHEEVDFMIVRETIGRSGYGKDGMGEFRESKLKDMSDAWVKASIDFIQGEHPHKAYYIEELEYRTENNIKIND